jgi:hypothetical protein
MVVVFLFNNIMLHEYCHFFKDLRYKEYRGVQKYTSSSSELHSSPSASSSASSVSPPCKTKEDWKSVIHSGIHTCVDHKF